MGYELISIGFLQLEQAKGNFIEKIKKNGYEASTAVIVTTPEKTEKLDFNYGTVLGGTDVCMTYKLR